MSIFIQSRTEKDKTKKTELLAWKIQELVAKAGELVTSNLLFIHAWCGCDTTSATLGHGKVNLIKYTAI